jgi:hypothetical protein
VAFRGRLEQRLGDGILAARARGASILNER